VSRWLETPAHVSENPGDLPAGFRAAGVACGLKPSGGLDLGLMVCAAPACVSAARFTRSGVLAAPVVLTKTRTRLDAPTLSSHVFRPPGWFTRGRRCHGLARSRRCTVACLPWGALHNEDAE